MKPLLITLPLRASSKLLAVQREGQTGGSAKTAASCVVLSAVPMGAAEEAGLCTLMLSELCMFFGCCDSHAAGLLWQLL